MPAIGRTRTGAFGSRFSFGGIASALVAVAAAITIALPVCAAEYRDDAGVFTISYDEAVWTFTPGTGGGFTIDCAPKACGGTDTSCFAGRLWVPLASVARLTREFDAKDTERAVLDGLIREKAERDKGNADTGAPEVVQPYRLIHTSIGHPVYASDYRVSLSGQLMRFLSFSTAARSYSVAIVCRAPQDALSVWRPRIDALIEGFRPAPDPFWLRWLARFGL
ncbi:hypothetical protein [Pseudorhodoplanes sp.]|jgi:hypothetical protein|uniref:hypothetical protein n=1 Tax=Pseudorhodoplanes sp. TaxID=1934341 RepID=UPI002CAF17C5|nr:hypothetical protein [Pseudorhodoplanes sp.]HWV44204.1 hypothetical protein [Pseudorhodoplanes sp.]